MSLKRDTNLQGGVAAAFDWGERQKEPIPTKTARFEKSTASAVLRPPSEVAAGLATKHDTGHNSEPFAKCSYGYSSPSDQNVRNGSIQGREETLWDRNHAAAPEPQPIGALSRRKGSGHYCLSGGTQNQGNVLGDRSCVRQSKLYRQYESGNSMKAIFGHDHLAWNTEQKEGAYAGQSLYDHNKDSFIETKPEHQHYSSLAGAPSRQEDTFGAPMLQQRPMSAHKQATYNINHRSTSLW